VAREEEDEEALNDEVQRRKDQGEDHHLEFY
jgi:hypothetical protein